MSAHLLKLYTHFYTSTSAAIVCCCISFFDLNIQFQTWLVSRDELQTTIGCCSFPRCQIPNEASKSLRKSPLVCLGNLKKLRAICEYQYTIMISMRATTHALPWHFHGCTSRYRWYSCAHFQFDTRRLGGSIYLGIWNPLLGFFYSSPKVTLTSHVSIWTQNRSVLQKATSNIPARAEISLSSSLYSLAFRQI